MCYRIVALLLVLAGPAGAESQVEQRAFEEIPSGVFIRGGATTINVDPRCPQGCPEYQTCQQVCEDQPCDDGAAPGSACSACTWRCAD
ncbi:MAG: hypothetical protein ACRERC_23290 [Candidatus Binatia bacterium]